jgi:hypothetical protein
VLGRRRRGPDPAALRDAIRQTIVRLDGERQAVAVAAGQALVSHAEAGRLCREQGRALSRAAQDAGDAAVVAERAAAWARADSSPEAEGYAQTAAALRTSQDVLAAAAEPVHALLADAAENVGRARAVLAESRAVLDTQLREQIRALQVVEAAHARMIAEQARRPEGG